MSNVQMIKDAELAQTLGYTRPQLRRRLIRLRPFLARHGELLRLCKHDHVVITDLGFTVLKRAKELEDLCMTPGEIRAVLREEFGHREEHELHTQQQLEALEAVVVQLEQKLKAREKELAKLKNALSRAGTSSERQATSAAAQAMFVSDSSRVRNVLKVVLAGIAGTVVMTLMAMLSPLMGLPPMDVANMLASFLSVPVAVGWAEHFLIGIMLAFMYALLFVRVLPGPTWARGMVYGLLPWLMAQLVVMPMMGMGFFTMASGSIVPALQSLMGHLMYGATVGSVYGKPVSPKC